MMKYTMLFLFLFGCNYNMIIAQNGNVNYMTGVSTVDNVNYVTGIEVTFFIPVADSNNFAGTNFRSIVLADSGNIHDAPLKPLTGAMLDSVYTDGAFVLVTEKVTFDPGQTKAQKRTVIDNRFATLKSQKLSKFYAKYDFWSIERVIP